MNNSIFNWLLRYKYYALMLFCTAFLVGNVSLMLGENTQLEQARSASEFVDSIGVATHLNYVDTAYRNYEEIIKPRLQELGIHHIRDGFPLKAKTARRKLQDLATIGIKSTMIMDPWWIKTPAAALELAKLASASIEAVEGPNEWDVHKKLIYNGENFPDGLRNFQAELYEAIKGDRETRHLDVLAPSIALWWNAKKLGGVKCDMGTMHSYPGGKAPTHNLDSKWIPATRLVCETKPIVATESGWHNATDDEKALHPGVSERASGKYVPRLYLEYFNRGIDRAFIYELIDEWDRKNQESNFGLLRNDGSPKPAFKALKNLITLLSDPGDSFSPGYLDYALSGDTKDIHHTLLQKRDGRFYLILWQEVSSFDLKKKKNIKVKKRKIEIAVNSKIENVNIYRPLKSNKPKSADVTSITVKVPDDPLVIELM
ncbi:MAG: hypothetical protein AB4352_13595 [Hormoscilla sp.]